VSGINARQAGSRKVVVKSRETLQENFLQAPSWQRKSSEEWKQCFSFFNVHCVCFNIYVLCVLSVYIRL